MKFIYIFTITIFMPFSCSIKAAEKQKEIIESLIKKYSENPNDDNGAQVLRVNYQYLKQNASTDEKAKEIIPHLEERIKVKDAIWFVNAGLETRNAHQVIPNLILIANKTDYWDNYDKKNIERIGKNERFKATYIQCESTPNFLKNENNKRHSHCSVNKIFNTEDDRKSFIQACIVINEKINAFPLLARPAQKKIDILKNIIAQPIAIDTLEIKELKKIKLFIESICRYHCCGHLILTEAELKDIKAFYALISQQLKTIQEKENLPSSEKIEPINQKKEEAIESIESSEIIPDSDNFLKNEMPSNPEPLPSKNITNPSSWQVSSEPANPLIEPKKIPIPELPPNRWNPYYWQWQETIMNFINWLNPSTWAGWWKDIKEWYYNNP